MSMKPSYTQAFDSIENCSIAAYIPLFHSEIGFTFGRVFIREGKFFIRRMRKRKITRPVCFVKQNKLFFVYDLFYQTQTLAKYFVDFLK